MFLAIVLVTGTIALSIPSFMIGAAQASSDREKDYDNEKSYIKYRDESSDEEKDNDDDEKSYGKDRDDKSRDHDKYDDKKSYEKDSYESQYSSYEKDDRDKSKKDSSSSSVSIKKVKCNNINVNLNGLDVNVGLPFNDGPVTGPIAVAQEEADDDYEESNSLESNNGKSYDGKDAQSDSDTNSRIVCINNNNNLVVGEELEPSTCEECFTTGLTEEELDDLIQAIIENGGPDSLQGLCEFIAGDLSEEGRAFISDRLFVLGEDVEISEDKINEILDCLEEVFGGDFPREILEEPLTAQQQMNWKS